MLESDHKPMSWLGDNKVRPSCWVG